ncbi:hypothetical protein [Streptomyces sp. NPDC056628]|uniref:hypothetical protein n=1 Tax=Streptomyces sp. NPDC056628 TaxID=3345882 RepID=UPI0036920502
MDVALEKRLLVAGGEDAVHGLPAIRQAHHEHQAGALLTSQAYLHVAEVHLCLGPRPVSLRSERVHRPATGLNGDLRPSVGDLNLLLQWSSPTDRTGPSQVAPTSRSD